MSAELTIQIVGYNGAKHLARAVEVLKTIPRDQVVIRCIDNASKDDSVEIVRRALPDADIVQLSSNRGYTGGHNVGLALCTTPFVLLHDQDVVIDWTGIKKLLEVFQGSSIAGVQGKVYRGDTKILDSAGIRQTLALNGVDIGGNEEDRGQLENAREIFAVQGACALYRMDALLEVAQTRDGRDEEVPDILDEDFFAYKDDVDLGWRLHQAGWKLLYHPIVMGQHARTLGKQGVGGWGLSPRNIAARLKTSRTRLSLRNYCWMIVKNTSIGQALLHSPFILLRMKVFFLMSVFYPPLFSVWKEVWQGIPRMLAKRA